MKAKFESPPINELIITSYFNPPFTNLRSEHIGLFWSKVRKDFPTVQQQPPVGGAETIDLVGGDIFPMPRYWFVSDDGITLLQVQRNAFMLNWRRRDAEYPHFAENLKPAFDKYIGYFEEFIRNDVGADEFSLDLCELTYINTVEACDFWTGPQDTGNVIPSFYVLDLGLGSDEFPAFNFSQVHALESDLQLRVTVRNAHATAKPDLPVLVFEIRAAGRLGQVGKAEADAWYERAHDAIISCFIGMTDKDIQTKYWKPVGGTS
jgi:uncharacterized protein (TIGR04255 family)